MTTIYHNPRCSKSRQTLALLNDNNIAPEIVLYLETPPNKAQLTELIEQLGTSANGLIRKSEDRFKELGLDPKMADDVLIEAMVENPKLIERPIVVHNGKARIGRPPEQVMELFA